MLSPSNPPAAPVRCITIDVEEYFHIEAAYARVPPGDRPLWPSRVEPAMNTLLDLLDRCSVKATLFFLADVAKAHPKLVARCAAAGHEIASHGQGHDRIHRLSPADFRQSARDSKHLLEDLTGQAVRGYRAPSWSITRQTAWALSILADLDYTYDASIFPVRHPAYGIPNAPTRPFLAQPSRADPPILELPPLTLCLLGRNLPAAGGAYFRLFPLWLMTRALQQAVGEDRPAILYFHPWEFDPAQPRMPLTLVNRIRTYTGIPTALARLQKLLTLGERWQPIAAHLPALQALACQTPVVALNPPQPLPAQLAAH